MILLSFITLTAGCTYVTNLPPGPLPDQSYKPKVGFEPIQKAFNEELYDFDRLVRGAPSNPNFYYYAIRNNIDQKKIAKFKECYGADINEEFYAFFTHKGAFEGLNLTGCYGYAFSESGLYISNEAFGGNHHLAPYGGRYFISYDDLYHKNTRFEGSNKYSSLIKIIYKENVLGLNAYIYKSEQPLLNTFKKAKRYAQTKNFRPFVDASNFKVQSLSPELLKLFDQENFDRFYFNGLMSEGVENKYRNCMKMNASEQILLIIDTNGWSRCNGVVISEKGFHIRNASFPNPDYGGYKFIPFSYYIENEFSAGFINNFWAKKMRGEVIPTTVVLHPTFGLTTDYNTPEDSYTIGYFMAFLVDAIQGRSLPTSAQLKNITSNYKKKVNAEAKRKNSSGQTGQFASFLGDVATLALAYHVITADEPSCQMPVKPSKNYGMLSLNRVPISEWQNSGMTKQYKRKMSAYRYNSKAAKEACNSKKNDLALLLSLLD